MVFRRNSLHHMLAIEATAVPKVITALGPNLLHIADHLGRAGLNLFPLKCLLCVDIQENWLEKFAKVPVLMRCKYVSRTLLTVVHSDPLKILLELCVVLPEQHLMKVYGHITSRLLAIKLLQVF